MLHQARAWLRARQFQQMIRFGAVGAGGTLVNSVALWLLVRQAGLAVAPASLLATELAIIHNFLLNDRWTFRAQARQRTWPRRLLRFNGVSLGGLCITVGVVFSATTMAHLPLIPANLLASGVVMIWNYLINSRWTWREPIERTGREAPPAI
jgi:dolichol-phosphate mannosyltransferase